MSLFKFGKSFIARYPAMLRICAKCYSICGGNSKKTRGKSNEIIADEAFMRNNRIFIRGSNNKIIIGSKAYLKGCRFSITGNGNIIKIGDMTVMHGVEICTENDNNQITIGNKCLFAGKAHLAAIEGTKISFGDNCLLSGEIVFRTGDSHSITDVNGRRINPSEDILVEDHVWIGYRVLINKGVHIMRDSIVGTGAIVTRKFEEGGAVIAGTPAKIVKHNVSWDINRI